MSLGHDPKLKQAVLDRLGLGAASWDRRVLLGVRHRRQQRGELSFELLACFKARGLHRKCYENISEHFRTLHSQAKIAEAIGASCAVRGFGHGWCLE